VDSERTSHVTSPVVGQTSSRCTTPAFKAQDSRRNRSQPGQVISPTIVVAPLAMKPGQAEVSGLAPHLTTAAAPSAGEPSELLQPNVGTGASLPSPGPQGPTTLGSLGTSPPPAPGAGHEGGAFTAWISASGLPCSPKASTSPALGTPDATGKAVEPTTEPSKASVHGFSQVGGRLGDNVCNHESCSMSGLSVLQAAQKGSGEMEPPTCRLFCICSLTEPNYSPPGLQALQGRNQDSGRTSSEMFRTVSQGAWRCTILASKARDSRRKRSLPGQVFEQVLQAAPGADVHGIFNPTAMANLTVPAPPDLLHLVPRVDASLVLPTPSQVIDSGDPPHGGQWRRP
jgi:hypothetical protein